MILRFFRRDPRQPAVTTLYGRLAAASRRPGLYTGLGVPDTIEGRLESLMLHAFLVLRALKRLPDPAGEVAQDLTDVLFAELDAALREMGIGDVTVPKRMKRFAEAYLGRVRTYGAALDGTESAALAAALARNVHGGEGPAPALARYVLAAEAALASLDLDAILTEGPAFPPPERFVEEA